jgi:hypothetical protein
MSPEERKAMQQRVRDALLSPVVIAAVDRANEAREAAAQAIARVRVSSEIELMGDDDGDE